MNNRQRFYKTDALILHSTIFGETDRLVTLMTWEKGKIRAVARGARKMKSKLSAGVETFTYGHYLLRRGRSLDIITQYEIKDSLSCLREPLYYAYAIYFAEIVDRMVEEGEQNESLCVLLYSVWNALNVMDAELLARTFELKLFNILGYRPSLDVCVSCGHKISDYCYFSALQGGMLCNHCKAQDKKAFLISSGTVSLAARLIETPISKLKILRPGAEQKKELKKINSAFLSCLVDTTVFRSRLFLESVAFPGIKKNL